MNLEITSRTDLALRAIRELTARGKRMSRAHLAERLDTTPDFLAQIITPLVRRNWIESRPGRSGGYSVTPRVGSVTLLQLIDAVEGIPEEGSCVLTPAPCNADRPCAMHGPWTRARDALLDELANTPLIETEDVDG